MSPEIAVSSIGLVCSTVTILIALNASSIKSAQRQAIQETRLNDLRELVDQRFEYVERAVDDIKAGARLTRRCTDCRSHPETGLDQYPH